MHLLQPGDMTDANLSSSDVPHSSVRNPAKCHRSMPEAMSHDTANDYCLKLANMIARTQLPAHLCWRSAGARAGGRAGLAGAGAACCWGSRGAVGGAVKACVLASTSTSMSSMSRSSSSKPVPACSILRRSSLGQGACASIDQKVFGGEGHERLAHEGGCTQVMASWCPTCLAGGCCCCCCCCCRRWCCTAGAFGLWIGSGGGGGVYSAVLHMAVVVCSATLTLS